MRCQEELQTHDEDGEDAERQQLQTVVHQLEGDTSIDSQSSEVTRRCRENSREITKNNREITQGQIL